MFPRLSILELIASLNILQSAMGLEDHKQKHFSYGCDHAYLYKITCFTALLHKSAKSFF